MSRCAKTRGLEVHHKRRDGGNGIDNAEVLCQNCHAATSTYGLEGKSPPEFSPHIKELALYLAGNQCQCKRTGGCH